MEIIYSDQPLPEQVDVGTIMLVGPTPREPYVASWRPKAIECLAKLGFAGQVFVPETQNRVFDWEDQYEWEEEALNMADVIVCWVPRNLKTMPAFTTNIEFGQWFLSGKMLFGAPVGAPNNKYMTLKAERAGVPTFNSLEQLLTAAVQRIGTGARRCGGECQVPLHIWNSKEFQQWYCAQDRDENCLVGAKQLWNFHLGTLQDPMFFWAIQPKIYISSEDRFKTNEVLIARPDISTVVMYRHNPNPEQTEIVLVKEFRAPSTNGDGCVIELPGGSSLGSSKSPLAIAVEEVHEETGLEILARLRLHSVLQLAATTTTHCAFIYSVELGESEWQQIVKAQNNEMVFGNEHESERTQLLTMTYEQIIKSEKLDLVNLGIISKVMCEVYNK